MASEFGTLPIKNMYVEKCSSVKDEVMMIDCLPDELMLSVFRRLETGALATASQVCSRWRNLILGEKKLWSARVVEFELGADPLLALRALRTLRVAPSLGGLRVQALGDTMEKTHLKQAILQAGCEISGLCVSCKEDGDARWSEALLRRHAEHLLHVELLHATVEALHALEAMPLLQSLSVTHCDTFLYCCPYIAPLGRPASLQRLDLGEEVPAVTALSLLRLHRDTLQEALIPCQAPRPGQEDALLALLALLRLSPGLRGLRRLTLRRRCDALHAPDCERQVAALRAALPASTSCSGCEPLYESTSGTV